MVTMASVLIDIPEATLAALNLDATNAGAEFRMAAAIKLFELGRLSSGVAAGLAGVSVITFISKLGKFGAETFKQTPPELADDVTNA
jgi:predicted HTH domain antitoxin